MIKTYVKPEIAVLTLRLEERIAACTSKEIDSGSWALNGNSPNRNWDVGDPKCWTWQSDISYIENES